MLDWSLYSESPVSVHRECRDTVCVGAIWTDYCFLLVCALSLPQNVPTTLKSDHQLSVSLMKNTPIQALVLSGLRELILIWARNAVFKEFPTINDSLCFPDKTIKLWKVSERDKRPEGYNLKDEEGRIKDMSTVTSLQVSVLLSIHILFLCPHELLWQWKWVSEDSCACMYINGSLAQGTQECVILWGRWNPLLETAASG